MARKRVDVRAILADQNLRRELMVSTIQATQAREGIETTKEQAEHAYTFVTEGELTAFFDLERHRGAKRADPDRREEIFVLALRDAATDIRFDVARRDFHTIDDSPLAFRQLSIAASLFRLGAPLMHQADVYQGLITRSDPQYIRCWWETFPVAKMHPWVRFHKGGSFSRFFFDPYLVIDWSDAARSSFHRLRDPSIYFRDGLTFPRAAGVFNARFMGSDCVFSDKGPAILPKDGCDLPLISGLLNSTLGVCLLGIFSSRREMGGVGKL